MNSAKIVTTVIISCCTQHKHSSILGGICSYVLCVSNSTMKLVYPNLTNSLNCAQMPRLWDLVLLAYPCLYILYNVCVHVLMYLCTFRLITPGWSFMYWLHMWTTNCITWPTSGITWPTSCIKWATSHIIWASSTSTSQQKASKSASQCDFELLS